MTQNAKKNRFVFPIIITALVVLSWQLFSTFGGGSISDKEKRELRAKGTKGVAILQAVERTGSVVNNIHQYAFDFEVKPDSGNAFPFREKKLIDPIYMSSIKVGMNIPAYVTPEDHSKVWIVWEEVGIKDAF